MSITIVNDWKFKQDANVDEAMEAASELVEYFKANEPGVQLSLWLKTQDEPLRYWHITVFNDQQTLEKARKSEGIKRFVDKFYPHMDRATHTNPIGDVVLCGTGKIEEVALQNK